MKIPIIRKGEYDIWSMRMRQYIYHTNHNLWDVIVNGDLEEEPTPTGETSAPPAPKTAKQLMLNHSRKQSNQGLEVYEDEMKRSSIPLLLLRTCHFFPLRTLQYNERALSLHNQQPVLNLKMRIFSIFDEETWKEIGILDAGIPGKRSYGDNGWSNAPTKEYSSQALVAQYGLRGYDRVMIFEVEPVQHSFNGNLFFPSSSSSSDNELKATSVMEKAQLYVGFALNSLTKEAQAVTSRNDNLAILECTQFDQTATIEAQMIEEMIGQD
ncbi:hypothetical protein Tco_0729850 [Tanacetum coccineum]|uniref:Uncharacterized protein n=1 Tax=Tanacetum coccineum TaxID=301880 RepID=A0ABQ4YQ06_9ASTR